MKRLDRSKYNKGQEMTGGPAPVTKGMPKRASNCDSTVALANGSEAFNKVFGALKALKLKLIRDQLKR
ncbi:hypothetical protein [Neoaquamicrobium sediminum]|uniref:hypothetical protein n=1 Tax=Neoaquamicrobium sediminum TaxID=1849104 RepID=UPI0040355048